MKKTKTLMAVEVWAGHGEVPGFMPIYMAGGKLAYGQPVYAKTEEEFAMIRIMITATDYLAGRVPHADG